MRDVDKLKEKIEVTLDNRQVVSLVIGSLIVLGVVFLLGIMVGKQVAVPTVVAGQQDVLAEFDKQAQNRAVPPPPTKPIDPPMTFQKILTDPKPPTPALLPKTEPKTELVPEKAKLILPTVSAAPKAEPAPKPESAPKPAPAPKAEESKGEVVAKAEASPKAAPAPKPEPKAEAPKAEAEAQPKAEAPPPALDKKLAAAFTAAKAMPKAEASEPAAPKPGSYTVQVAASQQKSDMDQVMNKLRGSGLRPYQINAEIPGRGVWYRVRVGSFPSKSDAERYASDLQRETGMKGFVTAASQ